MAEQNTPAQPADRASVVPEQNTPARPADRASLFDVRMIIALLFGIYGVALTVVGIGFTTHADLDKAGGINVNLWSGVAMLLFAMAFAAWVWLRPLRISKPVGTDHI